MTFWSALKKIEALLQIIFVVVMKTVYSYLIYYFFLILIHHRVLWKPVTDKGRIGDVFSHLPSLLTLSVMGLAKYVTAMGNQ